MEKITKKQELRGWEDTLKILERRKQQGRKFMSDSDIQKDEALMNRARIAIADLKKELGIKK